MTPLDISSLDEDDYDPLVHVNAIFSHPSTLNSAGLVCDALEEYGHELDKSIANAAAIQEIRNTEHASQVSAARGELAELFAKIEGVQQRAAETEHAISTMTADIKRLDSTKKNLTQSMTALKRLQMLTTAYEQLRGMIITRQYRDCAQLLQAVMQLMAHFRSYRSIDQIAVLSKNVAEIQRELLEQVCEDFELAFTRSEVQQKEGMLAEACLVMDVLGENARSRLITWYCNTQLREYRQVFRGSEEAGSLDNISRRYSWFNRVLKSYETEHAVIFPSHWRVNEMLANAFCEGTRDDFRLILQRASRRSDGQSLDANLLLDCMQETLEFEQSLEKRLTSNSRLSVDTNASKEEKASSIKHAISSAFEPYMSVWVESQDTQLKVLISKYRSQPIRNADEEFSSQAVIASSTELFHFYRLALAQCIKLSTGFRLVELAKTFAKYLEQYGQQILCYYLGEKAGSQGPSLEDVILVLNTADYCYITCNQLEERIKGRIDEGLVSNVDLQSSADAFMGIASAAVRMLVRMVDAKCEPAWREMKNANWSKLENVIDQSSYLPELLRRLKETTSEMLNYLHKQQYARALCDNIVDSIINTYIINIVSCKPICEAGAEQMLLDTYVLKDGLQKLPALNAEPGSEIPTAFVKRVSQKMAKLDPLLKTLQVRPSPPEALVQAYFIHIGDRSEVNFKKILDLKGIRKADQSQLIDIFLAHKASPAQSHLADSSPLLSSLTLQGSATGLANITSLNGSASPVLGVSGNRFDPATFGNALITAARDGVERFGTPKLADGGSVGAGGSAILSGTVESETNQGDLTKMANASSDGTDSSRGTSTNLNENLKNIGKFFKRDMGQFGNFGRKTDASKS